MPAGDYLFEPHAKAAAKKGIDFHLRMCVYVHTDMKKARAKSEALSKEQFRKALQDLWPVAGGSLSLRKSPCVREHCQACLKNEGHRSYVLYGKTGNKRFSLYIPVRLVPEVQTAIRNGRRLQELISAAGVTYVNGLKQQKVEENV